MEKNLLEKLLNMSGLVVSTGGGFPVFNENMKYLNDHGITVYLRYNVKTLWSRLHNDRIRPLSSSAESTAELLASRESIYRKAQIIIDGESNLDQNILLTLNAIRDRYPEEI
jgi:shikimate kinase